MRLPAYTAYLDPDPEGLQVSPRSGIRQWCDPALKVSWFGELKAAGALECRLLLRLEAGAQAKLRLSVAGQAREASVKGEGTNALSVRFGPYQIPGPGYQRLLLESLSERGKSGCDLEALVLEGVPAQDAQFNLKPRRNAASVHLAYPTPGLTNIEAFYCEVTAVEDPLWTFYMACGWHRGYFGMQINSPTERRVIQPRTVGAKRQAKPRIRARLDSSARLRARGRCARTGASPGRNFINPSRCSRVAGCISAARPAW